MSVLHKQNMSILYISQYVHITYWMRKKIYIAQRNRMTDLLREVRLETDLTQVELAARIQKDQAYVSRYESGQRRLDVLEVREICQAIGITLEEFVKRLEKVLK